MKESAPNGTLIRIVKDQKNTVRARDVIFKNIDEIDDQLDRVMIDTLYGQQLFDAGELYLRYNPKYEIMGDVLTTASTVQINRLLALTQRTN